MAQSFLPRTDRALLAWSLNAKTLITATPTAFGLTSAIATQYGTLHDAFATALAACDPGVRNKAAVLTKNEARKALIAEARLIAKLVEGTASVSNAQKAELGLNVRATPTPIPPPATSPQVDIVSATASRLFRMPSGKASTAAGPRSTMSRISERSSKADTFLLSSAWMYVSIRCRMAGSYIFRSM